MVINMKFKWDKKYLYWGLTGFLVIIASISFFLILSRMSDISDFFSNIINTLKPVIYGLCFAYLMIPILNGIEKPLKPLVQKLSDCLLSHKIPKTKLPLRKKPLRINALTRAVSTALTVLISLLLVFALFSMVLPQLLQSLIQIFKNLPEYGYNLQSWLNQVLEDNPEIARDLNNVFNNISSYLEEWLKNTLIPQMQEILQKVTSGLLSAAIGLKNILIGVIISIYVLSSKDLFASQAKRVCYALLETAHANSLIKTTRKTHKIFGGFIYGKLLDSLIIGILCFLCMSILQWPYPVLISVIIGVTNIIPFFGPFIGAIPSAILILLVDPMTCLYFIIFVLLLQQFDGNILGPKILGDSTGLSSFWVITAILVSGGLFGFIGMLIGVPTFAVIYTLSKEAIERSLKGKSLPSHTKDYQDLDFIDKENGKAVHFSQKTDKDQPEGKDATSS